MFRPEWLNIAMGNARAELKEKADYITTDCDKDGIYNACKHFKWIDQFELIPVSYVNYNVW